MAKKQNTKRKGMGFAIFMALYAILSLTGIFFGLKWFWGFMEAYEASRPHIAIDAYMDGISRDKIVENCDVILEKADLNLQSQEECLEYLRQAVSGEITYARKASACTETEQTYILRSGETVIGSFVIEAGQTDEYGFTPWQFKEESFDLSYLMGTETISVTVPGGCVVCVNGVELDERYITNRETREFEVLDEFYGGSYELPQWELLTYEAGPFLNAQYEMEVYDANGKPFTMDENFDENSLIALTDPEAIADLDAFLEDFIEIYVVFAGCANDNRYYNYSQVIKYVVPESNLAKRMLEALDGLHYAQSKGDEVADIQVNHYIQLPDGKFMCDVTYKVNTIGTEGMVQTTTNAKLIIVESGSKLLVESMIHY